MLWLPPFWWNNHERCAQNWQHLFNTLRPRQNFRHFPDHICKCIFMNENVWISITISLKFVPKGPINNIPASVLIMTWGWSGDKPLSESMMTSLLTHICVTWPRWVNMIKQNNMGTVCIIRCAYGITNGLSGKFNTGPTSVLLRTHKSQPNYYFSYHLRYISYYFA